MTSATVVIVVRRGAPPEAALRELDDASQRVLRAGFPRSVELHVSWRDELASWRLLEIKETRGEHTAAGLDLEAVGAYLLAEGVPVEYG